MGLLVGDVTKKPNNVFFFFKEFFKCSTSSRRKSDKPHLGTGRWEWIEFELIKVFLIKFAWELFTVSSYLWEKRWRKFKINTDGFLQYAPIFFFLLFQILPSILLIIKKTNTYKHKNTGKKHSTAWPKLFRKKKSIFFLATFKEKAP